MKGRLLDVGYDSENKGHCYEKNTGEKKPEANRAGLTRSALLSFFLHCLSFFLHYDYLGLSLHQKQAAMKATL